MGDSVRKNEMLITLRSQRVKVLDILLGANFSHRQVCFDTHVRLIAVLLCEGIPSCKPH